MWFLISKYSFVSDSKQALEKGNIDAKTKQKGANDLKQAIPLGKETTDANEEENSAATPAVILVHSSMPAISSKHIHTPIDLRMKEEALNLIDWSPSRYFTFLTYNDDKVFKHCICNSYFDKFSFKKFSD